MCATGVHVRDPRAASEILLLSCYGKRLQGIHSSAANVCIFCWKYLHSLRVGPTSFVSCMFPP